jgi:LPS sulfotransferase NodH
MGLILCATQRCGSTMIMEDMRNTGVLGQPEEWFLPWDPANETVDWADALQSVLRRASDPQGGQAIKIMANQLAPTDACLSRVLPPRGTSGFAHLFAGFADWNWVFITRQDLVLQAISRVMSKQTGINHATGHRDQDHFAGNLARGYDAEYNARTVYRYADILAQCTAITLENLLWEDFFRANDITPLRLRYEDVAADADMQHLDRMAALAGQGGPLPKRPRVMVKLGNRLNHDWRARFFRDAQTHGFRPK